VVEVEVKEKVETAKRVEVGEEGERAQGGLDSDWD
jgi:hypothetical protein